MASAVWGMTQQKDPGGYYFSSVPKASNPRFLQVSLVHFALPLLDPNLSDCKQNFVHWPFKRLSEFPAIFPWKTEILLLFTAGCYLGSFPVLVL